MKDKQKRKIREFLIKVNQSQLCAEHGLTNVALLDKLLEEFVELMTEIVKEALVYKPY